MRFYLARHAETAWNREGRYQGRRESSLSELGERQARALGGALRERNITRIISSPLQRCVATAAPLANELGLAVERDEMLTEIAHGTWETRLRDEIAANDRARFSAWRSAPWSVRFDQGESLADVLARWRSFRTAFEPRGDTLVVTHDVVVRVALIELLQMDPEAFWNLTVRNAAFAEFECRAPRWRLVDECVDAHVAEMLADASLQAL
ncbi:MAG: histidine phosphatase family protein [Candidatus Eremiobacteraeota bacterium]|nr:histidine phosphatase family protein [Candidatus Eremiobacteraeota bacterium]